jgi:hypothetical protein
LKELHTLIPKVDSLRWETHIDNIEIVSSKIGVDALLISIDGGHVIEGSYEEPIIKLTECDITKGITTRINKVNRVVGMGGSVEERIVIQVNAKMLRERYFEGITKDNLRVVYDYIIGLGLIKFSYETFLDGYVYDVDICMDVETDVDVFEKMLRRLIKSVKPSQYKKVASWFYDNNIGVLLGTREKSTASNPCLKFYAKGLELCHKETRYNKKPSQYGEFNRYWLGDEYYNLGRLELSIKNREMFAELGLTTKDANGFEFPIKLFRELLDVDKQKLKSIITTIVKEKYMDKRVNINLGDGKVLPKDDFVLHLIAYMVDAGESRDFFMDIADRYVGDYTQKSRYRKMVKKYLDNVAFREKLEHNHQLGMEAELLGNQFGLWPLSTNT